MFQRSISFTLTLFVLTLLPVPTLEAQQKPYSGTSGITYEQAYRAATAAELKQMGLQLMTYRVVDGGKYREVTIASDYAGPYKGGAAQYWHDWPAIKRALQDQTEVSPTRRWHPGGGSQNGSGVRGGVSIVSPETFKNVERTLEQQALEQQNIQNTAQEETFVNAGLLSLAVLALAVIAVLFTATVGQIVDDQTPKGNLEPLDRFWADFSIGADAIYSKLSDEKRKNFYRKTAEVLCFGVIGTAGVALAVAAAVVFAIGAIVYAAIWLVGILLLAMAPVLVTTCVCVCVCAGGVCVCKCVCK